MHPEPPTSTCLNYGATGPSDSRADRISRGASFWAQICGPKDDLLLKQIRFGVRLEWLTGPPTQIHQSNQPSALRHAEFVSQEIAALAAGGAVSRCNATPRCVYPLGVVPKPRSNKLRLILDMRQGNKLMPDRPFRMESLEDIRFLAKPGDVMLAFDLTQGYHHITIHPTDRTFLGFQWQNHFYQFNVLPFGLKSAPRTFSKVVTLLARSWRTDGIRILVYLDDWLVFTQPHEVETTKQRILADCQQAHLQINFSKSTLEPTVSLTHLGVVVNLTSILVWLLRAYLVPISGWLQRVRIGRIIP